MEFIEKNGNKYQKYCYIVNHKSSTSGYDKYIFSKTIGTTRCFYTNTRTNKRVPVYMEETLEGYVVDKTYERIFDSVPEYFAFCENNPIYKKDSARYKEELKKRQVLIL